MVLRRKLDPRYYSPTYEYYIFSSAYRNMRFDL
jgi:hypothetical protein